MRGGYRGAPADPSTTNTIGFRRAGTLARASTCVAPPRRPSGRFIR